MNASPIRNERRHGFTLLELVLALTILAMLTTTVFSIVRASMDNAMFTQQLQKENDEVNRFVALCRQAFQSLPSTAILTLTITDTAQPVKQELTLSGAPDAFSFGVNPMSYKDTILCIRPDYAATQASQDGQPLYYLGLSREDLIPTDPNQGPAISQTTGNDVSAPDDQGRYWMPLISNALSLTWRFYKVADDTWVEEWDSTDLPQLVEMNLLLQDRTLPLRVVFALPTIKLAGANPSLVPRTTTTSSGSSNQQGQGGGNNSGQGGGNNSRDGGGRGREDGGDRGRGDSGRGGGGQRGPGQGQGSGQGGGPGQGGGGRPGGSQNFQPGAQPGGGGGGSNGAPSGGGR